LSISAGEYQDRESTKSRPEKIEMPEARKKCIICAKEADVLKGGICEPCQDRIRREALGERSAISDRADKELARHGVPPTKK
jgi:hypothetical protein